MKEEVVNIIGKTLGIPIADIKMSSHFMDDLGCDSLDTVELIMVLEEHFNIEIPDHEAERMETAGSVVNFVTHELQFRNM
jgi:acyl carrier protein